MHQVNDNKETLKAKFNRPSKLDAVVEEADLNATQKRYFESQKYESMRRKNDKRVGYPTVREMQEGTCYAGALLPYKTGYKKLQIAIEQGRVLEASRATPWPLNPSNRCPPATARLHLTRLS